MLSLPIEGIRARELEKLEEIASRRSFTASVQTRRGSVGDINTFIDSLRECLKSGMEQRGLSYDFIVSPCNVTVLFKAELWRPEELRHV